MVLSVLSDCYPTLRGRSPTRYSPVRHWGRIATILVRLACIRHAASVHPEPGSNSPHYFHHPCGCFIFFTVFLFRRAHFLPTTLQLLRFRFLSFGPLLYSALDLPSRARPALSYRAGRILPHSLLLSRAFVRLLREVLSLTVFFPALPGNDVASIGPAEDSDFPLGTWSCFISCFLIDLPSWAKPAYAF